MTYFNRTLFDISILKTNKNYSEFNLKFTVLSVLCAISKTYF